MPIPPTQCRAARALLDWTQHELAERAEGGHGTIRGFEADRDGSPGVRFNEPESFVASPAVSAASLGVN